MISASMKVVHGRRRNAEETLVVSAVEFWVTQSTTTLDRPCANDFLMGERIVYG